MRAALNRSVHSVVVTVFVVVLSVVAWSGAEAQPTYRVLFDLDNNPSTGCSVTVDGETFDGAEQMLVTTQGVGAVTQVVRHVCTDPGTDTFGPAIPITVPVAPPWPIGLGLGTDGANVIETYVPFFDLNAPLTMRLGFATSGSGGEDALFGAGLFEIQAGSIPTLSTLGLLALVVFLAGTAALLLGRRGRFAGALTVLLAAVLVVGSAVAAILLDGQPGDWTPADLVGTDPIDGSGADLRAAFARYEDGQFYFRFDAFDQGCAAGDVPFDGDFEVVLDAWADYGIGDIVPVEHVPNTNTFRILSTNNPYISNTGTSYLEVTLDPVSTLVTVVSNECFDYGPGFCLNVTGTGTANCDGVIDLTLTFVGFGSFQLVLQPT